jgi:hypothetical protein
MWSRRREASASRSSLRTIWQQRESYIRGLIFVGRFRQRPSIRPFSDSFSLLARGRRLDHVRVDLVHRRGRLALSSRRRRRLRRGRLEVGRVVLPAVSRRRERLDVGDDLVIAAKPLIRPISERESQGRISSKLPAEETEE